MTHTCGRRRRGRASVPGNCTTASFTLMFTRQCVHYHRVVLFVHIDVFQNAGLHQRVKWQAVSHISDVLLLRGRRRFTPVEKTQTTTSNGCEADHESEARSIEFGTYTQAWYTVVDDDKRPTNTALITRDMHCPGGEIHVDAGKL